MATRTGNFLVVESSADGTPKILSLHRSFRAAVAKVRKLRRKAAEPWRFTVNAHLAGGECIPGPVIDLPPVEIPMAKAGFPFRKGVHY